MNDKEWKGNLVRWKSVEYFLFRAVESHVTFRMGEQSRLTLISSHLISSHLFVRQNDKEWKGDLVRWKSVEYFLFRVVESHVTFRTGEQSRLTLISSHLISSHLISSHLISSSVIITSSPFFPRCSVRGSKFCSVVLRFSIHPPTHSSSFLLYGPSLRRPVGCPTLMTIRLCSPSRCSVLSFICLLLFLYFSLHPSPALPLALTPSLALPAFLTIFASFCFRSDSIADTFDSGCSSSRVPPDHYTVWWD